MVELCKFVLDPASKYRCEYPFGENWRENCHGRRGYDWSTDDPAKIDMASVRARKLSQISNDTISVV